VAADDLYNEKEQFNDAVEAALAYKYIYIYTCILFFGMRSINTIVSDSNSSSSKVHSVGQSYQLVQKKTKQRTTKWKLSWNSQTKDQKQQRQDSYNMNLTFGP
jgi:hypothetical protein